MYTRWICCLMLLAAFAGNLLAEIWASSDWNGCLSEASFAAEGVS